MRKYLFNGAVLGAVFGTWSVVQQSRKGPRDWRLVLSWVIWALSLVLAVGTVRQESKELAETEEAETSGLKPLKSAKRR
jgi:hypothetical protein